MARCSEASSDRGIWLRISHRLIRQIRPFHVQKRFDETAVDALRVSQFRAFGDQAVLVLIEQLDIQHARFSKQLSRCMEFQKRKVVGVAPGVRRKLSAPVRYP